MGKYSDQWIASVKHLIDNPPHKGLMEPGEHLDALATISDHADAIHDAILAPGIAPVPAPVTTPAIPESHEVPAMEQTATGPAPSAPVALAPEPEPEPAPAVERTDEVPGDGTDDEDDGDSDHEDLT